MKKTIYLGPTIIGVATTSTVFDGTALPATITEAAQEISIHALREEGDRS